MVRDIRFDRQIKRLGESERVTKNAFKHFSYLDLGLRQLDPSLQSTSSRISSTLARRMATGVFKWCEAPAEKRADCSKLRCNQRRSH
jgi:hypothetical protein